MSVHGDEALDWQEERDYLERWMENNNRIPVNVAYKVCGRCGADLHAPDPPHICKDLQARMKRQERYVSIVENVLGDLVEEHPDNRPVAEEIVKRLLNAGIEGEP